MRKKLLKTYNKRNKSEENLPKQNQHISRMLYFYEKSRFDTKQLLN